MKESATVVILLVALISIFHPLKAVALDFVLKNGIYVDVSGKSCPVQMIVDVNTGDLLAKDACQSDAAIPVDLPRIDAIHFGRTVSGNVLTAKTIAFCTPKKTDKTPCDTNYGKGVYDPNTGALLLKAGDVLTTVDRVAITNYISFETTETISVQRAGVPTLTSLVYDVKFDFSSPISNANAN